MYFLFQAYRHHGIGICRLWSRTIIRWKEARIHDANYLAPGTVTFRLINKSWWNQGTQEVFFGEPCHDEMGTFIISGEQLSYPRVVRSQGLL